MISAALVAGVLLAGACISGPASVCRLGAAPCEGVCVDLLSNPEHCGACGQACDSDQVCIEGQCGPACGNGTTCGTDCADVSSDPRHCGGCEIACAEGQVCREGQCQAGCDGGAVLCEGQCRDVLSDEQHCGACGEVCRGGQVCRNGVCECEDILTDVSNCGECGASCAVGSRCENGTCRPLCAGRPCEPGTTVWGQRIGEPGGPVGNARAQDVRGLAYDANGVLYAAVDARRETLMLNLDVNTNTVEPNLLLVELDERGFVSRSFLASGNADELPADMAIAPDGSIWVAGRYNGTTPLCGLPPSQGEYDGFLIRISADFTGCSAIASLTSSSRARLTGLALSGNRLAVSGEIEGPATLVTPSSAPVDLAHAGAIDAVLAELDTAGDLQWSTSLGGVGDDAASDVVFRDDSLIAVGYYHAGFASLPSSARGQRAMWLGEIDEDGTITEMLGVPVTSFGSNHLVDGIALAQYGTRTWVLAELRGATTVGDIEVASHVGTQDVMLVGVEGGEVVFASAYGDDGQEQASAIWADARGVVIAGSFERRIDFGLGFLDGADDDDDDAFVVALDGGGAPQWVRIMGGPNADEPSAIAGYRGRVAVGGQYQEEIDLGLGPLLGRQRINAGGSKVNDEDGFLVTLAR